MSPAIAGLFVVCIRNVQTLSYYIDDRQFYEKIKGVMGFLKEGSISYEILVSLKDIGSDFVYLTFIHPPRSMSEDLYHVDQRVSAHRKAKGISQLKKQGLLEEYKKGGERYLRITQKGKVEIIRYELKEKTRGRWDKKWRVVIFDIPEATRKDRNFLRRQLKWLGFSELQKSVWVFPYETKNELKEFIKLCKVELRGDIRFLTVDQIDEDGDLRRHFGLK
jgi:CRISPR-associated endonuclease Cas2